MEGVVFKVIDYTVIEVDEAGTNAVLDATPIAGLTRREDLAASIYTYLITMGHISAPV